MSGLSAQIWILVLRKGGNTGEFFLNRFHVSVSDSMAVVASRAARFAMSTARNTIPAVVDTAEPTMSNAGVRKRSTVKGGRLAVWGTAQSWRFVVNL